MKIAFMFPGQGAQKVGMCKDIYDNFDEARKVYKRASNVLGIDIADLCFDSSDEELNKTSNTQIAIVVSSLAICKVLEKYGIKPDVAFGLSLGEYTSLIYSDALDFESGIKLVRKRGEVMEKYSFNGEYSMAAIIGLDSKIIEDTCKEIDGFVVPANYNYSAQTVISGYKESVLKACEILKEKGAKRAIELNTSGPFHTEKLNDASNKFKKELDKYKFKDTKVDVIKNLDGTVYKESDNHSEILAEHMVSPVRLDKTLSKLNDENIDLYVEIGPGKVIGGFVKKENKEAKVINIDSKEGIDAILELVKEKN